MIDKLENQNTKLGGDVHVLDKRVSLNEQWKEHARLAPQLIFGVTEGAVTTVNNNGNVMSAGTIVPAALHHLTHSHNSGMPTTGGSTTSSDSGVPAGSRSRQTAEDVQQWQHLMRGFIVDELKALNRDGGRAIAAGS